MSDLWIDLRRMDFLVWIGAIAKNTTSPNTMALIVT